MGYTLIQGMWDTFWFKTMDARQYAALRISFGGLSAVYLLGLLPYLEIQFSGLGWLGNVQQIAIQNGGSWSLFFIQAGLNFKVRNGRMARLCNTFLSIRTIHDGMVGFSSTIR